jgi:nicotinamidase/pyrazinamidase
MDTSKKLMVIIDMQEDFVRGSLATDEAKAIVSRVVDRVQRHLGPLAYTLDTHDEHYLSTSEGQYLPVVHCVKGERGHALIPELEEALKGAEVFEKHTFGSVDLARRIAEDPSLEAVELMGLCSDICVVSNALMIKAMRPELRVIVDGAASAGSTPERHKAALLTMQSCQIDVL